MGSSQTRLTASGLERRIRRHLHAQAQLFFAVCAPGLERFLEREIRGLPDVAAVQVVEGGVEFKGDFDLLYHANLHLRTANRVVMRIDTFIAQSYPELYNKAAKIGWERYLGMNPSVRFDVTAKKSRMLHEKNIAKAVFDAMVAQLSPLGLHVTQSDDAALRVYVRVSGDACTLSMDTTGEVLYKHGWREETGRAPLRESFAYALLMACDFQRFPVIADPLCGSGTFIIEAAQALCGMAPGSTRGFAFESWPGHKAATWNFLKRTAAAIVAGHSDARLIGGDQDPAALRAAGHNAQRAGVTAFVTFERRDCLQFNADGALGDRGLLIANLPYGKRTGDAGEVAGLYRAFGERLRASCRGWRYGLLVPDSKDHRRLLGLRTDGEVAFVNGGIPVRFLMGAL